MPELVNPLAAFRDSYGLLEGMAQDRTRRMAGNALAGGDYQGAQAALYGRGMLNEGAGVQKQQMALQDREIDQQTAQAETAKKAAAERAQTGIAILTRMKALPAEQIDGAYQSMLRPFLEQTLPPEMMAQVDAAPKTTENIDILLTALGAEAAKYQVVQRGQGGYDVLDMSSGDVTRSVEPMQEPDAPPAGYRWTQDGDLAVIPGGPADPRVAGARAAATRAPARPRAGSGAGGGGASALSTEQLLAIVGGG